MTDPQTIDVFLQPQMPSSMQIVAAAAFIAGVVAILLLVKDDLK